MVAKCVVGALLVVCSATTVLGGVTGPDRVKLAKFEEPARPGITTRETPGKVKVQQKSEYYQVEGITADELRAQMRKNGTSWDDGKVYAALTTWDIRYHYDIVEKDGQFRLDSVQTEVDIVFHLPRLSPLAKTPDLLKQSWNEYEEHLKTHEDGHRDIAVAMGEELSRALCALGGSSSKRELDEKAHALVQEKFRKLKEAQIAYDTRTHHGIKQGAVLHEPALASSREAK